MKEMRKCARKEAGKRGGSKTEWELNKKYLMQISNLTTIIMELSICSLHPFFLDTVTGY